MMNHVARRKLGELLADGHQVCGVMIARQNADGTETRGAVSAGGLVIWWHAEQARQCSMSNESKALELAQSLRDGTYLLSQERDNTADALERQHAEIESLRAQLATRVPDKRDNRHASGAAWERAEGWNDCVRHMLSAAPSQQAPVQGEPSAAVAWAQGYRQGIDDERTSEANIGIAGFGAKVEPARQNPYANTTTQQASEPMTSEELWPIVSTARVELFDLAQQWSDNKIHSYQFAAQAEQIVGTAIREAERHNRIGQP
jgi:hypothetical protein